jgi:transposase
MDRVALAGVDWGKSENVFVVRGKDGAVWRDRFPQTPQGVHLWAASLRSRYPEGKVAVALEQSRGALIYALSTYDFIELLTVHPSQTAAYRGVARPSGAKSDPIDADLIYDFVEKHSEKVRALPAVDALTRELTLLVEWRRKLVEQRTSLGQQLMETLGQYYPQALELMGERNSPMSLDFILQWSTLEKLQRSRPATIRNFYTSHNCRSKKVIEQRLALIASAVALHTDAARISALSAIACSLASLVQSVSEQISELDRRIKELWASHPDYAVLDSFPGVGEVFGPRLAAALGTDRDRWDATTLSNFSGIAPLTEASGSTRWVHVRWACPKFIRQTFHEFAGSSIAQCGWAAAFYQRQRAAGKGHHSAVRALAFRWIRILVRCWKDRVPYDDARYTARLIAAHSPTAPKPQVAA